MFRLVGLVLFGLAFCVASVFAAAPKASKAPLEAFFKKAEKYSSYKQDTIRHYAVEELLKSLRYDEVALNRAVHKMSEPNRLHEIPIRQQREIISRLSQNERFQSLTGVNAIKAEALFAKYGERLEDFNIRTSIEALGNVNPQIRIQAIERLAIAPRDRSDVFEALKKRALLDSVDRVREAAVETLVARAEWRAGSAVRREEKTKTLLSEVQDVPTVE